MAAYEGDTPRGPGGVHQTLSPRAATAVAEPTDRKQRDCSGYAADPARQPLGVSPRAPAFNDV